MDANKLKNSKNFNELLDNKYGIIGTEQRDKFEQKAQYFVISEMLKDARKEANMTQEQLAEKVGTKKAISHDLKTDSAIFNSPHSIGFSSLGLVRKSTC